MNEAYNNLLTRRSVRSFTSDSISREDLEKIVKAGMYAPSAMNKQTWQFTVIQDKGIIKKLESLIETHLDRPNYTMYNPDAIILVSNDRDNSNGLADCSCAAENIFLAAHALGIGSVWINQLKTLCDFADVREVLTSLKIPENHIVWVTAALGYSATPNPDPKPRTAVVNYF